jgi:hypothetical protein
MYQRKNRPSQKPVCSPLKSRSVKRHLARCQSRTAVTVALVGCGNIGSKLAVQLPLLGIQRILLIDPDRICHARNSRCCEVYASRDLEGRFKVDVLGRVLRASFSEVRVAEWPVTLNLVGLATLRGCAALVGALDSRRGRYELAEAAMMLDLPLVDLAIGGRSSQLVARARTTWTSRNGIDPLNVWSARDWQLLERPQPCGGAGREAPTGQRPVASTISGSMAAALGLMQIDKLLAGDMTDIGWETRIDLNAGLVRCRLPRDGSSPLDRRCRITEAPLVVRARTLVDLVKAAEHRLGPGAEVHLRRPIVTGTVCNRCERRNDTPEPWTTGSCEFCGGLRYGLFPVQVLAMRSLDGLVDAPLGCLGTRDDILLVQSEDGSTRAWFEYHVQEIKRG